MRKRLLPVAAWRHDKRIEPDVVARYVQLRFARRRRSSASRSRATCWSEHTEKHRQGHENSLRLAGL
jgi:hypothetical protein